MEHSAGRKYEELRSTLSGLGSALVAYSGGVDSTFLAFAAQDALGTRSLAVLATSAAYAKSALEDARLTAAALGLRLEEVETGELADQRFRSNPHDRCYYCKTEMFKTLRSLADERGLAHVLDGTNADDTSDHRPGRRAAIEYGVLSPLLEVGLTKDEIRELSRELGLPTWNMPSGACLASRFPYHTEITEPVLLRVADAEDACRDLGFPQVRVRVHGDAARVEVPPSDLDRAFAQREGLVAAIRASGFAFAALDLEGYSSGSLNRVLGAESVNAGSDEASA